MIRRILAFLLLLWLLGFAWFALLLPQPLGPQRSDAIVVLTGGNKRIDRGLELMGKGEAQRMLISGVGRNVKPEELAARYPGFAKQFDGLENLYQEFKDQKFVVLGFPSNQFNKQEPVSNEDMLETCRVNFGVTFPLNEKINVNGPDASPLFQWLKQEKRGILNSEIKWNFTKFLINREGEVVKRYPPTTEPKSIVKDIEKLL